MNVYSALVIHTALIVLQIMLQWVVSVQTAFRFFQIVSHVKIVAIVQPVQITTFIFLLLHRVNIASNAILPWLIAQLAVINIHVFPA